MIIIHNDNIQLSHLLSSSLLKKSRFLLVAEKKKRKIQYREKQ
jgi:hypothetical protein